MTEFAVSVRLDANGQGFVNELTRSEQALESLKNESKESAKEARDLNSALDRLERSYDPLASATRKYAQDLDDIQRLYDAGAISAERATRLNEEATRSYEQTARGMDEAEQAGRRLGTQLRNIAAIAGTALAAGLTVAAHNALEMATQVRSLSNELGVGTEQIQIFRHAIEAQGGSASQADEILRSLAQSIGQARIEGGDSQEIFDALGVSLDDVGGNARGIDPIFRDLAGAIGQIEDPAIKARIAQELFGESSGELIGLLASGREGYADLAAEAQNLGIILEDQVIEQTAETNRQFQIVKNTITSEMAGVIAQNSEAFIGMANALGQVAVFAARALAGLSNLFSYIGRVGATAGMMGQDRALGNNTLARLYALVDPQENLRAQFQARGGQLINTSSLGQGFGNASSVSGLFAGLGNLNASGGGIDLSYFATGDGLGGVGGDFNAGRARGGGAAGNARANREAAASAREHAREQAELQRILAGLTRDYDPATEAARDYARELADIARLVQAGVLDPETAARFQRAAEQAYAQLQRDIFADAILGENDIERIAEGERIREESQQQIREDWIEANLEAADIFRDNILDVGHEFAEIIGGEVGDLLDTLFQALAARPGDQVRGGGILGALFNLANSPSPQDIFVGKGGSLTDINPDGTRGPQGSPTGIGGILGPGFQDGMREIFDPFKDVMDDLVGEIGNLFGGGGASNFAQIAGQAAGGAAIGSLTGQLPGFLGLKTSKTGGAIGGAIGGAAFGPIGAAAGGFIGSTIGGLFKKNQRGSAIITGADDPFGFYGNSSSNKDAAAGLASEVQAGLSEIARALGGEVGSFLVSIGIRDGSINVDPQGRGYTKTSKFADIRAFGEDAEGARNFAIADAIADGAIIGLSAAMKKALSSSPDLDAALEEALKVREIEDFLGGMGEELERTFRAFEVTAKERLRIAREYGFDVVKIEEKNAEDRKAITDQYLEAQVGSLRDLLDDLNFGSLFEGSAYERRDTLLGEVQKAIADSDAGKAGANDRLASLLRQLTSTSREAFGTAGPEFASDLERARSEADRLINLEEQRVKDAQEAAQRTNSLLNENNDQNSTLIAKMDQLIAAFGNSPKNGAGGSVGSAILANLK